MASEMQLLAAGGVTGRSVKLPEWREVFADYVVTGIPADLILREKPRMVLSVDSSKAYLAARFETDDFRDIARPFRALTIQNVKRQDVKYVELAVRDAQRFESFFFFALTVLSRVASADASVVYGGVEQSVDSFDELLSEIPEPTLEKQVGLFAELCVLRTLVESSGSVALDAWTGPRGDPHDFRLVSTELEVKATLRDRRRHIVGGLSQLQSSGNNRLLLVSAMVARAGLGGESIEDVAFSIERLLDSMNSDKFRALLSAAGARAESGSFKQNRWQLVGKLVVLPVRSGTPRLTQAAMASLPAEFVPERISILSYEIDITGLGTETELSDLSKSFSSGFE